jgi:hypothetical protein
MDEIDEGGHGKNCGDNGGIGKPLMMYAARRGIV